ncbi:MAG: DUF2231 domain-containing protein [Acidobacteriota bacterium]
MNVFPPIPSWDGLHPLIVHFPIALLLIAPILIILGLTLSKYSKGFFLSALVLMIIGTIAVFVATSTGEAAGELAERMVNVENVLEQHEELAETTRTTFTALTIIFAAMLFLPALLKKNLGRASSMILNIAFLVFYLAGALVLANTAHQGGRLVHELGVRAMVTTNGGNAQANTNEAPPAQKGEAKHGDDDD